MNPLNCILLDDSLDDQLLLEDYLRSFPSLHLAATFDEPAKAIAYLAENSVDVIISDVEMPGLSGLQFLKTLKNPPIAVLVSSHPQYALESFEVDALDFLSKPVSFERFAKTVQKIVDYAQLKNQTNQPSVTISDHFVVKTNSEYVKLQYNEVLYAEAMVDFVTLRTETQKLIVLVNLKNLLEQLPTGLFARCHRSYIVNMGRVKKLTDGKLILDTEQSLPIGREYEKEIETLFLNGNLVKRKG